MRLREIIHTVETVAAQKEKINEVRAMFEDAVLRTNGEEGCLRVELFQNSERPHEFVFETEFEGMEAVQKHMAAEWRRAMVGRLPELVAEPPRSSLYRKLV